MSTPATPPSRPDRFRGAFLTGLDARRTHAEASGPYRFLPTAVAEPADVEDVACLCRWATREGLPLVPRGAGTGMPGGNVGPGVVVDLARLDAMEALDPATRSVRVGPGVVAERIARAAEAAGLYFPSLPSSADRCTVGGMVAANAAGARSFLHGAVRDWVVGVEVVLADGEVRTLGPDDPLPSPFDALHADLAAEPHLLDGWPRVRKNSSGYALDRFLPSGSAVQLLTGSEGTLGLVTSLDLRLIDPPRHRGLLVMGVAALDDLPGLVAAARRLGASACEYFGRRILDMARLGEDPELGPVAKRARALLLVEMEGDADRVEEGLRNLRTLADDASGGWVEADSAEARDRLWDLRHRASPTIARAAERGLRSVQFIEDCVVPPAALASWVRGLGEILDRAGTDAVVFGHAGDGNLHVNPLLDLRHAGWREGVRTVLMETADLVASLGGTLSGEHGDGRVRAPLLERIWCAPLARAFRRVKDSLDPVGILNPGVILPLPGQDPLEGLLRPLPPS